MGMMGGRGGCEETLCLFWFGTFLSPGLSFFENHVYGCVTDRRHSMVRQTFLKLLRLMREWLGYGKASDATCQRML
jgi:hypothetical protein